MIASSAFWSNWAWAAATAVVGFVFFGLVLRQYLARRKPHQLAWFIWRFARRHEYGYRVWANVSIAAGAALLAFLGSRARLGNTTGL